MEKLENYNPLEKKHIGESVVRALLDQPVTKLAGLSPFTGAGVYAIYYTGRFPVYSKISKENSSEFNKPIYVGKAVPAGARKGLGGEVGQELFKRLREHGESVKQTTNLDVNDFYCRYLTVDDIWIPLGESLLIEKFKPVWNVVVDGFGNHDPGSGRYEQMKSRWDTLHTGRSWAEKCKSHVDSLEKIVSDTKEYLSKN